MKALAFAYHNMGIAGLEALKRNGFDILAVFSHRDDREENIWFGSVAEWAETNKVPLFCPDRVNAPQWVEKIRKLAPEIIFSFYYRHLLSRGILEIPAAGAYNLHGSLLPAYRGRCPVNWVLVKGEKKTGVTLHYMVETADAGDIVGQREVPIDREDKAVTLYEKLCSAAGELLDELLPLMRQGIVSRIPQEAGKASYFGGRKPEDGQIDWSWPVEQIYNLIRAVTEPYPGAFTHLPEGKVLIWWALPHRVTGQNLAVGTVETKGQDVYVHAADGRLQLLHIEINGQHMRGPSIYDYFRERKEVILR